MPWRRIFLDKTVTETSESLRILKRISARENFMEVNISSSTEEASCFSFKPKKFINLSKPKTYIMYRQFNI